MPQNRHSTSFVPLFSDTTFIASKKVFRFLLPASFGAVGSDVFVSCAGCVTGSGVGVGAGGVDFLGAGFFGAALVFGGMLCLMLFLACYLRLANYTFT